MGVRGGRRRHGDEEEVAPPSFAVVAASPQKSRTDLTRQPPFLPPPPPLPATTNKPTTTTNNKASKPGPSASGSGAPRGAGAARRRCGSCGSNASASEPTRAFFSFCSSFFAIFFGGGLCPNGSHPSSTPLFLCQPHACMQANRSKELTTNHPTHPISHTRIPNTHQADRDRRPALSVQAAAPPGAARRGGRGAGRAVGERGPALDET